MRFHYTTSFIIKDFIFRYIIITEHCTHGQIEFNLKLIPTD